ncbi:MAG: hypothetical protein K2M10_09545, partial [Muribaculaceae bacterium]|nr:hypothetical protein [Muribaculaceae bacterium]
MSFLNFEEIAEFKDVEFPDGIETLANADVQEIADTFIRLTDYLSVGKRFGYSPMHHSGVGLRCKQDCIGIKSVASGTSRLLIIFLQRGWEIEWDNDTNIRRV